MPAAAQLAPCPVSPRSNSATRHPAAARRQPIDRPMAPPPMMATLEPDAEMQDGS
jgi:hypothetical protein